MKKHLSKVLAHAKAHRTRSSIIAIVAIIIIYYVLRSVFSTPAVPQYSLTFARTGNIVQTVSGTGQISASNQTDIPSQVSGMVKTINVSVGQPVKAGDLIATIDYSNAAISLQSSRIALAKLTEPAKATDLSTANNNLTKAYDSGWNAVAGAFLDMPAIVSGMKDMLYTQSGFISDQNSSFLVPPARTQRDAAAQAYDTAVIQYQKALLEYQNLNRNSAASSLDNMFADAYAAAKGMAQAVTSAQNAINFIITVQPEYQKSTASSALTSITSWANTANSDVSNIVSAQNSINGAGNALTTLQQGADSLDIQSAQLNLQQAQKNYDNYFIRAPYDGVIGRIPVNLYGQAGSGTTMATIVGQQKIAAISLNEVDAAKVAVGQPVNITFDAIDGLNATGTVSVVDQVGSVSQGVVSYAVKIAVSTDDARIKPGMSVNTSIVTKEDGGVLIVPSSAVKTSGNKQYVQVFDRSVLGAAASSTMRSLQGSYGNNTSTTTRAYAQNRAQNAQSNANFNGAQRQMTVSTAVVPNNVTVTVGDSDDTNTQILSGLNRGDLVVVRTTNASTATAASTAAPSILSAIGGQRTGGGGNAGAFRAAAGRPGN